MITHDCPIWCILVGTVCGRAARTKGRERPTRAGRPHAHYARKGTHTRARARAGGLVFTGEQCSRANTWVFTGEHQYFPVENPRRSGVPYCMHLYLTHGTHRLPN